MSNHEKPELLPETKAVQDSLRKSVRAALERKRKLGHYAIVWDGEKPVRVDFGKGEAR